MQSYFNGIWKDTNYQYHEHSGYSLVDYVNSKNPSSVLDVGCGYNKLKSMIPNLIGIDPYNDAADIKVSIEEYKSVPFDMALCLGSINFGDEKTIDNQIDKLHTLWRREAIFRHYCPSGQSRICADVSRENLSILIPTIFQKNEKMRKSLTKNF